MTYAESAALMTDPAFRDRIKVACLTFANYIMGEANNTAAHTTRLKWAQSTFQQPDVAAAQVQPATVMDPQVQSDGSAITDANLQESVETTLQAFL